MGSRRFALLGVAVFAAVSTASCGSAATPSAQPAGVATTAASPTPTRVDARAELLAATAKTSGSSMTYGITATPEGGPTSTVSGKIDPATHASTYKADLPGNGAETLTMDMIAVGTDLYLRMNLPIAGIPANTWLYIDGTKVSALGKLGLDPSDPSNLSSVTKGLVSAEKTGPGAFKGVLDLTKNPAANSARQQLGDAAKAVPFQATVSDGYLATMTIVLPAGTQTPPATTAVRYSDFGAPVTITKPAGSKPAPQALLDTLR